ncbi:MAG: type II toxin-antitoxin system VapC family toxin [Anaerolineales bacterium]|nr:type II toxin-antitoxin system VapC family toxin [Anaerolineales bacterium]
MPGPYTVDASVFLNAFNPRETGHTLSRRFLVEVQTQAVPLITPTLALPEVAAAVRRGRGDAALARSFALALQRLPQVVWMPLDEALARRAVEVAALYALRGSDAVYAAVALQFGATLVTLDQEQRERVKPALKALSPEKALAEMG